jgi:hypothetical protein
MYLDGAYAFGAWQTVSIALDNLANAAIVASTLIDFGGAAGIEIEANINGTPTATAFLNIGIERVGSDGSSVSAYENAKNAQTMFFSATPNLYVRYSDMPLNKAKLAVENKTGAALGASGNTLKYRTVTPRSTAA